MANWLESLERFGSGVIDAATEGVADRIKSELNPDAPNDPAGRPETQYDTTIQQPLDGVEAGKDQGVENAFGRVWSQYKWWIAGGLGITAYLAWKGGR
jgi:hypothetical protein